MAWRLISSTRVWNAVTNSWNTVTSNRVWDAASSTWKTVTATYVWAEAVIRVAIDRLLPAIASSFSVAAARNLLVSVVARAANVTTNIGAAFAQFTPEDRTQNKAISGETVGRFYASVARGLLVFIVQAKNVTTNIISAVSRTTEDRTQNKAISGTPGRFLASVARGMIVTIAEVKNVTTNIPAIVSRIAELRDVTRTIAASTSAAATRAIDVAVRFSKSIYTNVSAFLVFSVQLRDVIRSFAGSMNATVTRALAVIAGASRSVTTNVGAVVDRIAELRIVARSLASTIFLAATRAIQVVALISRSATANMNAVVSRITSLRDAGPFSTGLAASTSMGASSTLSLLMVQTTGVTIDAGGSFTTFSSVDARPNPPTNPGASEDLSGPSGNVDCSWSNAQTSHDNNVVNRAPDNGSNAPNTGSEVTLTQTLGPTTTTYDDNSQLSDGTYWYRYGAKNASGVRYSSWTSVELGGEFE